MTRVKDFIFRILHCTQLRAQSCRFAQTTGHVSQMLAYIKSLNEQKDDHNHSTKNLKKTRLAMIKTEHKAFKCTKMRLLPHWSFTKHLYKRKGIDFRVPLPQSHPLQPLYSTPNHQESQASHSSTPLLRKRPTQQTALSAQLKNKVSGFLSVRRGRYERGSKGKHGRQGEKKRELGWKPRGSISAEDEERVKMVW